MTGVIDWLKDNADQVATGLLVLLLGALAAIGRLFGRKPEEPKAVELAGAVVDATSVRALIASQEVLSAALRENSEASRATATGIAAIVGEVRRVSDATNESNDLLDRIKDELQRRPLK